MVTLKISVSDTIKTIDVFGILKKRWKVEHKPFVIFNNVSSVLDILFGGIVNYSRPPTSRNMVNFTKATL